MDLRGNLQNYFLSYLKKIRCTTNRNIDDFIDLLKYLNIIVDEEFNDFENYTPKSIKFEYLATFHSKIFNEVLINFSNNEFFDSPKLNSFKQLTISLVKKTNSEDVFINLVEIISKLKSSRHQDLLIEFLKFYISKHLLLKLFQDKCSTEKPLTLVEDELIKKVTSLPDNLVNQHIGNLSNIFYPQQYFKIVAADINQSLIFIYTSIKSNIDISIGFLSVIYGKMCFLGYSDIVSSIIIKSLVKNCYNDPIWSRISQSLFTKIPFKYLESSLTSLVKSVRDSHHLSLILGDIILASIDIRTILTQKFIFLKIFSNENTIQNIIGYLCESASRKHLYIELFRKILSVWSTQGSISNTSYEQHLYLTKCILVCKSFMNDCDKQILSLDLIKYVLTGVEAHLSSPIESMRLLGMIIGENLMNELSASNENSLKFEYEETHLTKLLKNLAKKPEKEDANDEENDLTQMTLHEHEEKVLIEVAKVKITQVNDDSDDDLQPYDLSNDIKIVKTKQPVYLRDLLDGLIYSEDPDKIELCLKSIDKLCKNYHYELKEVCVELVKILLHKSNNFSIENFDEYRRKGLIEIVCHYPIAVGQYLTTEFYEPNYTLSQRMDILHVLASSAQKLSDINEEIIEDTRLNEILKKSSSHGSSPLIAINKQVYAQESSINWREIIQKRIELKTKRKSQPELKKFKNKVKENKFGEVAGYFFFPLIKPYDVNRIYFRMLDNDYLLLGKLVFTLAVILYSAVNTLILDRITESMLNFLVAIKTHTQPFIRKSILFAFTMILISSPTIVFKEQIQHLFVDLKSWTEYVALNDPDSECQKQAIECLNLLNSILKKVIQIA